MAPITGKMNYLHSFKRMKLKKAGVEWVHNGVNRDPNNIKVNL